MANTARRHGLRRLLPLVTLCAIALRVVLVAQGDAPRYKFDPDWPKPLPNKWKLGGITGLAVDKDDNVWVLNRPERSSRSRAPGGADTRRPPPVASGRRRWFTSTRTATSSGLSIRRTGHGMDVDSKGFVYVGQDTVRKYDPKTGKRSARWPRAPEPRRGAGGGAARTGSWLPDRRGRGAVAPVLSARFRRRRRSRTPRRASRRMAAIAAFRAKYPPRRR